MKTSRKQVMKAIYLKTELHENLIRLMIHTVSKIVGKLTIRAERELEAEKGHFVLIPAIPRDPNIPDMVDEQGSLKERLDIDITMFTLLLAVVIMQVEKNWAPTD